MSTAVYESELNQLDQSYYEYHAEREELQDYINNSRLKSLLPVWKRIQRKKDEKNDLTLKEYREITGRQYPVHTKKDKFGRVYVSWDDAIDNVAAEYGYERPEYMYNALEKLADTDERAGDLKLLENMTKARIKDIQNEKKAAVKAAGEIIKDAGRNAKNKRSEEPDTGRKTGNKKLHKSGKRKFKEPKRLATAIATNEELMQIHRNRTPQAIALDESMPHQVTINNKSPKVINWLQDQGKADIRGIDTPRITRKKVFPLPKRIRK